MKKIITMLLVFNLCLCGCVAMPEDVELFDPLTTLETATENTTQETAEETTQPATVATTEATTEATEPAAVTEASTEPPALEYTQAPQQQEEEQAETPAEDNTPSSGNTVWIPTKGGKKYHSKPTCSNMSNPDEVTKAEAESQGFTPCKKCYK